jgi:hypothetical protein
LTTYRLPVRSPQAGRGLKSKDILPGLVLLAVALVMAQPQAAISQGHAWTGPTQSRDQQRPGRSPGARTERGRSITGRVLGEGGQPVAEASVLAMPAGAISGGAQVLLRRRAVLTDESGRFVIQDLRPGAYALSAFVPGFVPSPAGGKQTYYRPGDSATLYLVKGGVITGAVTTLNGDPVVGIRVRAMLVREASGRTARARTLSPTQLVQDWKTDDRGVYRIFGLDAGSYVVSAGGRGMMNFSQEGYDNDASTFHPSSTRDTAVEVKVRAGDETSGIDIQYRDGRGYAITGIISGAIKASVNSILTVILAHAATGAVYSFSFAPFTEGARSFQFDGVPDGSYELIAVGGAGGEAEVGSPPRRVDVRGRDVTGVELVIGQLGSIGGRLVLEKASGADAKPCPTATKAAVGDIVMRVLPEDKVNSHITFSLAFAMSPGLSLDGMPDEKGDFKIRPLEAGRYRVEPDLPTENWFLRAITLPALSKSSQPVDASRGGIQLKAGESITGLTVAVAEGAAGFSGQVAPARQGASIPSGLRLYLLPAEKDSEHDVLRFFESAIDKDGNFSIGHIAPGRYLVLAKESTADDSSDPKLVPLSWRPESRTKLRREAEASNVTVELLRCQRVSDYVLRYTPPPSEPANKR